MLDSVPKRIRNQFSVLTTKVRGKYQFLVFALAFGLSVASYWDVLPGIFQDEYVYSMGARKLPLEEQAYPNYLFAWIYQTTNLCGAAFYTCAKSLNTVFFIALLTVFYLLARVLHSQKIAVLLSSVAAVSPATIFASFFMPEILFFTINLTAIYFIVRASRTKAILPWVVVVALLGLALLTKRHELFLLPGYTIAIFMVLRTKIQPWYLALTLSLGAGIAGPVLLRQLVVFGITGDPWAALLGQTYVRSFRSSLSESQGSQSEAEVLQLITQGFLHLLFHGSILIILGLGFVIWRSSSPNKEVRSDSRNFAEVAVIRWVVLGLVISIVPVVTFFESYLTLSGDSHAFRLLGRYYEFIFLVLLLLGARPPSAESLEQNRKRLLALVIAGYLVFTLFIGPFIRTGPADSPTIHGLRLLGPILLVFFGLTLYALIDKAESRKRLRAVLLSLLIPLLVLSSGFMVRADLRATIGTEFSYFDRAGKYFQREYPEVPGEAVLVIGRARAEVVAAKFGIDQPNIRHSLQPKRPLSIAEKNLRRVDYVITLFPAILITDAETSLVHEGNGFRVFRIG